MSTSQPTKPGALDVTVESASLYLGSSIPIEIRDARMHLVTRGQGLRVFQLPEGIYQVSAVLEDGQEHVRLVQVRSGERAVVRFDAGSGAAPITAPASAVGGAPTTSVAENVETAGASVGEAARRADSVAQFNVVQQRNSRYTRKADAPDDEFAPEGSSVTSASVLGVKGAKLIRETRNLWIFEGLDDIDAVATALLQVGERRTEISLPTNPRGMGPSLCAVRIDACSSGAHATAWISPERTVANALQNMLASGQLSSAAAMADQATELLNKKYADPTGATLGALILRKVGRLPRLESWMENLARDFAWIPDAKVLLAALLVDRRGDLQRALSLALEASRQRLLYTESYSILLDLLRRWPRDADLGERTSAMAELAARSPYLDWNSTCFSLGTEG